MNGQIVRLLVFMAVAPAVCQAYGKAIAAPYSP